MTAFAQANAQVEFAADFTPSANCWSILIYASPDAESSPSFRSFGRLVDQTRSQNADAADRVVVFSPFETSADRRPTRDVLDALLAWFRQNRTESATLRLPAARGDRSAPLEIRLVLCGQLQGAALRLPDSSQTIELDAFRSALREGDAPCERTLFFLNLASETRTRGSSAVVAPLIVDEEIFDDENFYDAESQDGASAFLESYYQTLFFNQLDSDFFGALANAFAGDADALHADGVVTALELLEHLRDVASVAPEMKRLGQDFPVAKTSKTPPAPPFALFQRASASLRAKNQTLLADEALRRALLNFEADDYAKLRFYNNHRPEFESLRDGAFALSFHSASWLKLSLNAFPDKTYHISASSFANVAKAAEERKSR
ncbi:MAG: hypothetical protein IJO46_04375 [Thermoguttaceae bacterium]|nr:hypothetical protein [Thermoguttaceae bacterium]